uniref:Carbonic anhydrase n=1 Tax=Opuntia streptacantha TaxID=393608 RepID=A0A7C8YRA8_OPUST
MNHPRNPRFTHLLSLFLIILFLVAFVTSQEVDDEKDFNYIEGSGKGPEDWGDLKEEWATCKTGNMQSPIDLFGRRVEVAPVSEEIHKFYNPGEATLKNRGHDISVEWKGGNSKININGIDYILRQVHWHSPSEHAINGRRYALELHIVHQSQDNKIAVIGLLYNLGRPDPFLGKLEEKIKSLSNTSTEVDIGIVDPKEIRIGGNKYYRYGGSLTTPPCTEGVIWTVNKQIATVSKEQVKLLREAVDDGARENARPLQPRNGRPVKLYYQRWKTDEVYILKTGSGFGDASF